VLRGRVAVEDAAAAALDKAGAARWVRLEVGEDVISDYRQEQRGRPGPNTRYRRIDRSRFTLNFSTDAAQGCHRRGGRRVLPLRHQRQGDDPAELLNSYKAQPHIERRHATFKGVIGLSVADVQDSR